MFIGTQNLRTVALMFIVLLYLMFGAAVFNALESKEEARLRAALRLRMARILYKNDTIQNESIFNSLTTAIFEHRHVRSGTAKQWTFPGAFYFSTLVVTLIGYGNIVPKTRGGRIFCMVYTVAGVPLNLIMFQSVGERLNAIISFVLSRLKRLLGFRRHKVSGFELITVEFGMSTMLILGGSLIFCKQEKWTYFESIYYSLVTFWTIGFGDFVPLVSLQRTGQSLYSRWGYYVFTISFILFGLAIMASSLNLLVLRLAQFHSENGIGGVSSLLGGNEEELIAAAIAEHRASVHIQHNTRIFANSTSATEQKLPIAAFASVKPVYSWWTTPTSSVSFDSNLEFDLHTDERTCCSAFSLWLCRRRQRRQWHLRRSPQNIKHLLHSNQSVQNRKSTFGRRSLLGNAHHRAPFRRQLEECTLVKHHRISI